VDPNADRKHDPIQRQEASLEENQAQALNAERREDLKPSTSFDSGEGRGAKMEMEGIWTNMEKYIWSKDHRGSSSGSLSNPLWPQHQNSRKNIETVFFLL